MSPSPGSAASSSASSKAYLKAVTGVSFAVGRRETRGAGGRIRLGQVDGGAHDGRPAAAHGRHGQHRRHRHVGGGARRRAPEAAPAPADDLPGPLRQPQSALARRAHHRRSDQGLRARQGQRRDRASRGRAADAGRPRPGRRRPSTRTSSRAASASASASPGPCRRTRSSSSATSRPARSTCRCRRRS